MSTGYKTKIVEKLEAEKEKPAFNKVCDVLNKEIENETL